MRGLLVILAMLAAQPGLACGLEPGFRLELEDGLSLDYRVEPAPLEVGRHFAMRIQFCRDDVEIALDSFRIDAVMPAHGHGMNYRVGLSQIREGVYLAEGMLFHMPGDWQVVIDFEHAGQRRRALLDIKL